MSVTAEATECKFDKQIDRKKYQHKKITNTVGLCQTERDLGHVTAWITVYA